MACLHQTALAVSFLEKVTDSIMELPNFRSSGRLSELGSLCLNQVKVLMNCV